MNELNHFNKHPKKSFLITIHYQENHTWQGTIQWLDKNITQHFRSALELIKLIDEAGSKESLPDVDSRTWTEDYKAMSS